MNHGLPTDPPSPVHSNKSSRRDFMNQVGRTALLASAASLVGSQCGEAANSAPVVSAVKKKERTAHMKLSLAAYSFHRVLQRDWTAESAKSAKMTLADFIDYCADLQLDGCELTSYYFPKNVTKEYLNGLKQQTFRLGLDISGTAIGNDFCLADGPARDRQLAYTRTWIDHAAEMGAPVIRIFAGQVPRGDSESRAVERCVAGINESLEYAAKKGVFLALENHGGITSTPEQLLRIFKAVKPSPWFGINFDGGNFFTADPYADLVKIAPYTINAQIKVEMFPSGKKGGGEPADLKRVIQILRDARYRGYVVLEYEAKPDPLKAIPPFIRQLRDLTRG